MIRLECTTGGSNKFYELAIEKAGNVYYVRGYYGAIGRAPTVANIGSSVSEADAERILNKKKLEKEKKGYREVGVTANPFDSMLYNPSAKGDEPRFVDDVPVIWAMNALGNKGPEHVDQLFSDDNYIAQEKLDGMRAIVHVTKDGLRIFSRSAGVDDPTRPLEKTQSMPHLAGVRLAIVGSVLDAEILTPGKTSAEMCGDVHSLSGTTQPKLYIFDMLRTEGRDLMNEPLEHRLSWLNQAADMIERDDLLVVPYATGERAKLELARKVEAQGGEGVMFKNLYATYQQGGRPSNNWYKLKKQATFDCVVMGFTPGQGKYQDAIGAVIFGQFVDGTLVELGQTSGMTDAVRLGMTKSKEQWMYQSIRIKGMERLKSGAIRHPQFAGLSEKSPKECIWYQGEQ